MNHAKKTLASLTLGLTVLLATLATPFYTASAGDPTGKEILPNTITERESEALLTLYSLEDVAEVEAANIKVKIYNTDDELIFSTEVCQRDFECDDRINRMINQSDFITEVDNTRIYYLDQ